MMFEPIDDRETKQLLQACPHIFIAKIWHSKTFNMYTLASQQHETPHTGGASRSTGRAGRGKAGQSCKQNDRSGSFRNLLL